MPHNSKTIWIIRDLEPLPTDPGDRRLMRAGMLAHAFARLGHSTRWITSSFDHYQKRQREPRRQELSLAPDLAITVLPGRGYRRNISLARIAHNRAFARDVLLFAERSGERPDVIVTDIPTTEAAAAVVAFGRAHAIPTVVSIRDLWPDFFTEPFPPLLRPLIGLALSPLEQQARSACANATALMGISETYLSWGLDKAGRVRRSEDGVYPLGYAPRNLEATEIDAGVAALGVRLDKPIVAFVGSWGKTYDLDLLLTGLRILGRSDIQFVIAGTGENHARLAPQMQALPNVSVPGWISANQIAALLSRSSIGLLPYSKAAPQGLPNKIFEYMAYGAFQISTLPGEAASLLSELNAGRTVPAGDPTALAAAIEEATVDPATTAGRDERRQHFMQRFHADAIYDAMANHILLVAEKGYR